MFTKSIHQIFKFMTFALLFFGSLSLAEAGDLMIENAWARATPGKAPNGAAYVTIVNHGAKDTLIGVETDIAKKAQVHTHIKQGAIMKMGPAGPVNIDNGQSITFQPGGMHIMLMKLKAPLKEGDMVSFTLIFEKAGERPVMAKIMKVGAAGPGMNHNGGQHMKKSD